MVYIYREGTTSCAADIEFHLEKGHNTPTDRPNAAPSLLVLFYVSSPNSTTIRRRTTHIQGIGFFWRIPRLTYTNMSYTQCVEEPLSPHKHTNTHRNAKRDQGPFVRPFWIKQLCLYALASARNTASLVFHLPTIEIHLYMCYARMILQHDYL